ncbi:glycoside hydrolase family 3 domain protein [Chloroherpeton thalassium ATCC 35110]|uniref:beta-N-acetylhexosaminidase n=1 Tax=Chloroherpeton thalassium (strain ATCC 35110 / GB-78) TaxID=517418 RepID=B3QV76_CHLT3|nr:glycoside hydrolase family 3 N-terminal domain-containing protein [Chloroherpeton thalassium]ACF13030.1 glycoside hydrolase family 3 domain protein [Chloroherpeton thalassium ATCC 35110]
MKLSFRNRTKRVGLLAMLFFFTLNAKAQLNEPALNRPAVADSLHIITPLQKEQQAHLSLFLKKWAWADSILATMTLEEKVGQMLVASSSSYYQSTDDKSYQELSELVKNDLVGGIMFSRGDVYELAMLANRYQSLAKYPLLISADMEWGVAMRVKRTTEFPNNMGVAATWNPMYAYEMGRAIAEEARALGIHQNYAPAVDLNNNPENPVINTRAFSENVQLTNAMAKAFVMGSQSARVIATAKHFPGHGDTEIDSHRDLPVLPFTRNRLDSLEFRPFKYAITNGVMSVMVGHLALPNLVSSEQVPATLSPGIISRILRKEFAFDGLIVTDAMTMYGIRKNYSVGEAAVKAVLAGNDILLMPPDVAVAHEAIVKAVEKADIPLSHIDESVRRILIVKEWLRLHRSRLVDMNAIASKVGTLPHQMLAQEIADHSITLLRNKGNELPLRVKTTRKRKLLNVMIQNMNSFRVGSTFRRAMKDRFQVDHFRIFPESNTLNYTDVMKAARKASGIVVSCFVEVRSWSKEFGLDAKQTKLLRDLNSIARKRNIPLVVVSFGSPYIIMGHSKVPAYLCAYSSADAAQMSVAKILYGEIEPQGRLPITIPGEFEFGEGMSFRGELPKEFKFVDYEFSPETANGNATTN